MEPPGFPAWPFNIACHIGNMPLLLGNQLAAAMTVIGLSCSRQAEMEDIGFAMPSSIMLTYSIHMS